MINIIEAKRIIDLNRGKMLVLSLFNLIFFSSFLVFLWYFHHTSSPFFWYWLGGCALLGCIFLPIEYCYLYWNIVYKQEKKIGEIVNLCLRATKKNRLRYIIVYIEYILVTLMCITLFRLLIKDMLNIAWPITPIRENTRSTLDMILSIMIPIICAILPFCLFAFGCVALGFFNFWWNYRLTHGLITQDWKVDRFMSKHYDDSYKMTFFIILFSLIPLVGWFICLYYLAVFQLKMVLDSISYQQEIPETNIW